MSRLHQRRGLPLPERILLKEPDHVASSYAEQFVAHNAPKPTRVIDEIRRVQRETVKLTHVEPSHYETTTHEQFHALDGSVAKQRSYKPVPRRVITSRFEGTLTSTEMLPGQWHCTPPRRTPHPRSSECFLSDTEKPISYFNTTTRDLEASRAEAMSRSGFTGRPPPVVHSTTLKLDSTQKLEGRSAYTEQFARVGSPEPVIRYTRKSPALRLRGQPLVLEDGSAAAGTPVMKGASFFTTTSQAFFKPDVLQRARAESAHSPHRQ